MSVETEVSFVYIIIWLNHNVRLASEMTFMSESNIISTCQWKMRRERERVEKKEYVLFKFSFDWNGKILLNDLLIY